MKNKVEKKESTISQNDAINNELIKDLKVHTNLTQEVIVTTEDKIRICLINYLNKLTGKKEWIAPFGILITIIIALLTTNFKKFYFNADTWTAVFIIAGALCLIWLFACIKAIFVSVDMDEVINELKKGSPVKKDKNHIIYVDKDNKIIISNENK